LLRKNLKSRESVHSFFFNFNPFNRLLYSVAPPITVLSAVGGLGLPASGSFYVTWCLEKKATRIKWSYKVFKIFWC